MDIASVEAFEEFVGRRGNVGESNPRSFGNGGVFPIDEVFPASTNAAAVEDGVYDGYRCVVVLELDG